MANGNGNPMGYLMDSLNGPATTPFLFLFLAGVIMVYALITSKKAQNVVKTSVDLSRQDEAMKCSVHQPWHVVLSVPP